MQEVNYVPLYLETDVMSFLGVPLDEEVPHPLFLKLYPFLVFFLF